MNFIKKYRNIITIILSAIGIGFMIYYNRCDTECRFLKGDLLGIDLKWVGIAYMAAIIIFAAFRQTSFVRALLAAGLGVEVYLYAFQIKNDVYCPFCLAFSTMVVLSFLANYEVPSAWRESRCRMWLYFLGEVDFPMLRIRKLPLLLFSLLGYLTVLVTFSGSVIPAYAAENISDIPSIGRGAYEITVFADYFCPPCKIADTKAEPLLKALLATKKVKIIFVDVPFHKPTPIYARYYLYTANANTGAENIFHVRNLLFEAAQTRNIQQEEALTAYLKEQNISWTAMDEKPIFTKMSAIIKKNMINATPTCVIKFSAKNVKKYVGTEEILKGLNQLKKAVR